MKHPSQTAQKKRVGKATPTRLTHLARWVYFATAMTLTGGQGQLILLQLTLIKA
jgi:hypothetical protein